MCLVSHKSHHVSTLQRSKHLADQNTSLDLLIHTYYKTFSHPAFFSPTYTHRACTRLQGAQDYLFKDRLGHLAAIAEA
jgi:hypothetical protein